MIRAVAVALAMSFASPALAKSSRKTIRVPVTKITCDRACKERVRLYRVVDDVVFGRLVLCAYHEPGKLWVREPGKPGECWSVVNP